MKPSDLRPDDPTPQRVLIGSRDELRQAVDAAIGACRRTLRVLHRDLAVFELASPAAAERLQRLLLSSRSARVRLLVDDPRWLESAAPRLRRLQQRFPHALEMRQASPDDPVADDAWLLADDHLSLELRPTVTVQGDLRIHHKPHAQPLIAAFDRRWEAGAHNLPVSTLGLS